MDSENRLIGVRPEDLNSNENYEYSMVKDEDQLEEYCNVFLKEWNLETVDNMYRVLFHLIFNGVSFDEAIALEDKQVNVQTLTISLDDKKIKISDKCAALIKDYKKMTHYTSSLGKRGTRSQEIVKNGFLLERTVSDRKSMKSSMSTFISKLFSDFRLSKKINISLTLKSIWLSGVFYRMYIEESTNGKLICNEYIDRFEDSNINIYTPNLVVEECKVEYNRWKNKFNM